MMKIFAVVCIIAFITGSNAAVVKSSTTCSSALTNCATCVHYTAADGTTVATGKGCTKASDGYFVTTASPNTDGTASDTLTPCNDACKTCTAAGADKCTACSTNYQADTSSGNTVSTTTAGKCCHKACATCVTATPTVCNTCNAGYGVPKAVTISTTPTACTECKGTNCASCDTTSDTTAAVCATCASATFLSADNKSCTACPSNCTSCPNATFCTTCNGSLAWNNGSQKCFGASLKVGSVLGSLCALAVLAFVF